MRTSESIGKLAAALAKAQAMFPPITRNRTVEVRSEKGNYSFEYATLDHILELTKDGRTQNGLALAWGSEVGDAKTYMTCRLLHESGEWLEARLELPCGPMDKDQVIGSRMTYRKRYLADQLLGLSASEDDDGNLADGNEYTGRDRKPRAAPTPRQKPQDAPQPPVASAPVQPPPSAPAASQEPPPAMGDKWFKAISACTTAEELAALKAEMKAAGCSFPRGGALTEALRDRYDALKAAADKKLDEALGTPGVGSAALGALTEPLSVNHRGIGFVVWHALTEDERIKAGDATLAQVEAIESLAMTAGWSNEKLLKFLNEKLGHVLRGTKVGTLRGVWQLAANTAKFADQLVAEATSARKTEEP